MEDDPKLTPEKQPTAEKLSTEIEKLKKEIRKLYWVLFFICSLGTYIALGRYAQETDHESRFQIMALKTKLDSDELWKSREKLGEILIASFEELREEILQALEGNKRVLNEERNALDKDKKRFAKEAAAQFEKHYERLTAAAQKALENCNCR